MQREFWACHGRKKMGPYVTRKEAVAAFRDAFPVKLPSRRQVTTGYGNGGAWFDIRFIPDRDDIETVRD